jgi:hypothetical protein
MEMEVVSIERSPDEPNCSEKSDVISQSLSRQNASNGNQILEKSKKILKRYLFFLIINIGNLIHIYH